MSCAMPNGVMGMATRFYHTRDPIENLSVRVIVRKVHHGEDGKPRRVAVGTTWSHSFHWQEKRSSQAEIRAKKAKKVKQKVPETGSGADAADGELGGRAESHGVALCSYIGADNYVPHDGTQRTSTTSQAPPPHLTAGASDYHLSKAVASKSKRSSAASDAASSGTSNADRVMLRLHREDTFRQMHLVLQIAQDEATHNAEDVLLATLRYYPHTGLLCSTPGFSTCISEDEGHTHSTKGPKLSTYLTTSRSTGTRYEYALDNENDLFPTESLDDQQILKELQRQDENEDVAVVEQWRNKHGDHEIASKQATRQVKAPAGGYDQKMVLLEIVSARGIDTQDPIRIEVEVVESPNGDGNVWTMSNGSLRSRTRLARPVIYENDFTVAAFGHHTQFFLRTKSSSKSPSAALAAVNPMLKIAVFSCDAWARERLLGHCELRLPATVGFSDTEVPLMRPLLTPQEQLEEFFLGSDRGIVGTALAGATETKTPAARTVVSRLGAQTISTSGRVRIRLNIIESRPQLVRTAVIAPLPPLAALSRSGAMAPGGGAVKRSVEEILQAVKTTKRYSDVSQGLASPLAIGGSGSSAVSAILARLQSQNTRGTSPSAG